MTAPSPDESRAAYLARVRARLVAARDGGPVPPVAAVDAPTLAIEPTQTPVHRDATPENVSPVEVRQPSPYSETGRPDDHHLEIAGLASALVSVAARLVELARSLRGEP